MSEALEARMERIEKAMEILADGLEKSLVLQELLEQRNKEAVATVAGSRDALRALTDKRNSATRSIERSSASREEIFARVEAVGHAFTAEWNRIELGNQIALDRSYNLVSEINRLIIETNRRMLAALKGE